MLRSTRLSTVVVTGALAAGAGVAVAQSGPASTPPLRMRAPQVQAVDRALAAEFAIFRSEPAMGTAAPAALAQREGMFGLDAALARRGPSTATGAPTYVVPGNGTVCLYGNEVGGACAAIADAVETPALTVGLCGASIPAGQIIVSGLVPDSASNVGVRLRDGTLADGRVSDNVFVGYTPKRLSTAPSAVVWTDASGVAHTQPLDVRDSAVTDSCEPPVG